MTENEAKLIIALQKIEKVLLAPASNRKFMQIAGPARQCRNIIKDVLKEYLEKQNLQKESNAVSS